MHLAPATIKKLYAKPEARPREALRAFRHYLQLPWWQRAVKRGFDIAVSLTAMILLAPLVPVVAFLIKRDSPGSFIYRQERVGLDRRSGKERRQSLNEVFGNDRRRTKSDRRHSVVELDSFVRPQGTPFTLLKLRSMFDDAESAGVLLTDPEDPRITRVGRLLRKYRLDEIPQFWNVLRGDMSVVGPRPERAGIIEEMLRGLRPDYRERLRFKPGITGLAQVSSGYDTSAFSMSDKLELDVRYINTYSLTQDFRICLKTFRVIFTGRGAL